MKLNSIGKNAFYNSVKQLSSIIFPLISFSYSSRVLGTEQLGKYSFGQSIISYFLLLSYLGIPNYAIREGTRCRENEGEVSQFINEIFSINFLLTICTYIFLVLCIQNISKVNEYKIIILIESSQILLTTIGSDWINTLFEDYFYLTVRYIVIQVFCIITLIIFVQSPNDIYKYTLISVIANSGGNLWNAFYLRRRKIRLKFTIKLNLKRHLKSILVLFFNSVASVVYLNSDVTMIGFWLDDSQVGIYTVTSKIYTMVKTLINAVIMVTVPRFSSYVFNSELDKYRYNLENVFKFLNIIVFPIACGMFAEAENIICIIAGYEYLKGINVIRILSISIVFAVFSCFFSYAILLPNRKEINFMWATIAAASANIVLNIFFIPYLKINGAAITTLIAEIIVFLLSLKFSMDIKIFKIKITGLKEGITGGIIVMFICGICTVVMTSNLYSFVVAFICSVGCYFFILLKFGYTPAIEIWNVLVKRRIK